jgi:hypothetical protein
MPAVLLSPRSVFFGPREDEGEDASARSEQLLLVNPGKLSSSFCARSSSDSVRWRDG